MGTARRCHACGSQLAADQRYCLACGERDGARSPQLTELLQRVGEARPAAAPQPTVTAPAAPATSGSALRLPGPWVSAALVLAFVGFGALLGNSAGSTTGALSASSTPLRLVVPRSVGSSPPGTGSAGSTPQAEGESSPSEGEGTSAGEQTAPEAAPKTAAPEKSSAKASSGSSGGEGGGGEGSGSAAQPTHAKLTEIKHVFLIVLSEEPYAANFGPESTDHYLARTLEAKGTLLARYDAIAHEGMPNGIALLSGQGPTDQTAVDCPTYAALAPGGKGADGQALGEGCVYPATVPTLPGQLAAGHKSWRAYVEGTDEGGSTPGPCSHPALGEADPTSASGPYATYRNPFVYFAAITGSPECKTSDVGLSSLKGDLASGRAPSLSYIVPDRCHDGGPTACSPGAPTGPADAAGFLAQVVPEIMSSPSYKKGGLIVITADDAPAHGEFADSSSCCGQPASYPNFTPSTVGHGGGAVGALLLSPLVKGGAISQEPYDHYSLLRTVEDVFGLSHIGYAALPEVKSLSASLLSKG